MSITSNIRKAYLEGKPLSYAQRHFLWFNYRKLGYEFEQMAKYYQLLDRQTRHPYPSFIQPHEQLLPHDIEVMYRRLTLMLAGSEHGLELRLTPAQFLALKNTIGELLFFHGNQLLTGAPFFGGGVPRVDFFQWGNLFGVVKYEELMSEKGINGNFLIHVEDMRDRTVLQCIHDYQLHQQQLVQQQAGLAEHPEVTPIYQLPRPRLSLYPG